MDAVTYPQQSVVETLNDRFALFRVNMLERHPDFKEACSGARVVWGPTFVIHDARGSELRRWTGWLPPESFIAELDFCHAYADYTHGRFAEALAGFTKLVDGASGTEIHPEALYWQGAAGFLAGKMDWDALRSSWSRLVDAYPGHRFAVHASVIEDAPA